MGGFKIWLVRSFLGCGCNTHNFSVAQVTVKFLDHLFLEFDYTVNCRIERRIAGSADISSGSVFRTVLANNNLAFLYALAAKNLHTKSFGDRVTA